MPESNPNDAIVDRYYGAMRLGAAAEQDMMALFADDATYSEPFSGEPAPAAGKDAIVARFRQGWEFPMPDLELEVLSMSVDGSHATTTWECRSPVLPGGSARGTDRYEFRDGLIVSLVVTIDGDATGEG